MLSTIAKRNVRQIEEASAGSPDQAVAQDLITRLLVVAEAADAVAIDHLVQTVHLLSPGLGVHDSELRSEPRPIPLRPLDPLLGQRLVDRLSALPTREELADREGWAVRQARGVQLLGETSVRPCRDAAEHPQREHGG